MQKFRVVNRGNVAQLATKARFSNLLYGEAKLDERWSFVPRFCDDDHAPIEAVLDRAAAMLEELAGEYAREVHHALCPSRRYSFRKFLADGDRLFAQCASLKALTLDSAPLTTEQMKREVWTSVLSAVLSCNDNIELTRELVSQGANGLCMLVAVGQSLASVERCIAVANSDEIRLTIERARTSREHGSVRAALAAKAQRAPLADVRDAAVKMAAEGTPRHNLTGKLAKKFGVSRPTIVARLKIIESEGFSLSS